MSYYDSDAEAEVEEVITPEAAKKKTDAVYGYGYPRGAPGIDFGASNVAVEKTSDDPGIVQQYQYRPPSAQTSPRLGRIMQREMMQNPLYYNRDVLKTMCDLLIDIDSCLRLLVKNDELVHNKERGRTYSSLVNLPADTLIYIDFIDPARNSRNLPVGTSIRNPGQSFSKLIVVNRNGPATVYLDSDVDPTVSEVSTPLPPTAAIDLPSSYPSISSVALKAVGGTATVDLIGII